MADLRFLFQNYYNHVQLIFNYDYKLLPFAANTFKESCYCNINSDGRDEHIDG